MSYAIVKDKQVVGIVLWDGDSTVWSPPADHEAVLIKDGQAWVGGSYDGDTFLPPPPVEVPKAVSVDDLKAKRQAGEELTLSELQKIADIVLGS